MRNKIRRLASSGVALVLALAPHPSAAADAIKIAEALSFDGIGKPVISETGKLAFWLFDGQDVLVFTAQADGSSFSLFASPATHGVRPGDPLIDGSGRVSFAGADLDDFLPNRAVYTGLTGPTRLFAQVPFPQSWFPVASARNRWYALARGGTIIVGRLDGIAEPTGEWRQQGTESEINTDESSLPPDFAISDNGLVAYVTRIGQHRLWRGSQLIADSGTPVRYRIGPFSMNGPGDIAFVGESENDPQDAVWVTPVGSNEYRLIATQEELGSRPGNPSIADNGLVLFQANGALYVGPDPIEDRVIGRGDPLDGSTINSIELSSQAINSAGEIAFIARLADNRSLIATVRASEPPIDVHWNAPAGGNFEEPESWLERQVPSAALGQNAVFDLAGSYTVDLGFEEVNRLKVLSGRPRFVGNTLRAVSPDLDAPSLLVDGELDLEGVELVTTHATIGEFETEQTPAVRMTGVGTIWTATGLLVVGGADNEGELRVESGAFLTSARARIGSDTVGGDVRLEGSGSEWRSGDLELGGIGALLRLRDGARVESGDVTLGTSFCLLCEVEVLASPSRDDSSFWEVGGTLVIGAEGPASVSVEAGGQVAAVGEVKLGVGAQSPGELRVEGVSPGDPTFRSTFQPFRDMLVGAGESQGRVFVRDGGDLSFLSETLAIGALSPGLVEVSGVSSASELASRASVPAIEVGVDAEGTLRILDGGTVACQSAQIGGPAGAGAGLAFVFGTPALPSVFEIEEDLFVGGTGSGEMLIIDGEVFVGRDLTVRSGGAIRGEGEIDVGGLLQVRAGGRLEPGVTPASPASPQGGSGQGGAGNPPSRRLSIAGHVELESGAVLQLDVGGLAPGSEHDLFEVSGDLSLAGTTVLRFENEFAPSEGDVLAFLSVGGITDLTGSSFEIEALAPGFEYEIGENGGVVSLTALNDGVYVPEPGVRLLSAASLVWLALLARRRAGTSVVRAARGPRFPSHRRAQVGAGADAQK